jgi:uncharacterized repeat protein (TIGR03847 family)
MAQPGAADFGDVDEIDVETIGQPGQRTFRMLAERGDRSASIWLEKEQLQAVGLVIDQQLARSSRSGSTERTLLTLAARFPSQPTIDFKVGQLAVGYDEQRHRFTFTAHDVERMDAAEPHFNCRASEPQARALAIKITEIVAAGRPRCPLCGAPMDAKHVCPLSNGHVH